MRDGEGNRYIDGPIIYWSNTDVASHEPERNLVEENTLEGCSIDLMHDLLFTVRRNTVRDASITPMRSR